MNETKTDNHPKTRIELSAYTRHSGESVAETGDLVAHAINEGSNAIVLKGFFDIPEDLKATSRRFFDPFKNFKVIYGTDLYGMETTISVGCSALIKNDSGKPELFKLMSDHSISYEPGQSFGEFLLHHKSDNLLYGSSITLFELIINGAAKDTIRFFCDVFDYYEVYTVSDLQKHYKEKTIDELQLAIKTIYSYGQEYNKPVVASGNVRYLNPENSTEFEILKHYKKAPFVGIEGSYFKTTNELLEDFTFLDKTEAEEIVVTNTHKLADMIMPLSPHGHKIMYPESGSEADMLEDLCWKQVRNMYGEKLPGIISKRLEDELDMILANGSAPQYILMYKIAEHLKSGGYAYYPRASVGSSFVAYLLGITSINPLPPHYTCPNCKHTSFEHNSTSDSGYDLPEQKCPVCGMDMNKDGHTIPYESFFGSHGEKEPWFDMNVGDGQKASTVDYLKSVYGSDKVFLGGWPNYIGHSDAEKVTQAYFEEIGMEPGADKKAYYVSKLAGVKANTQFHPTDVFILPSKKEIYDFTPLEKIHEDGKPTIVTHFWNHFLDDQISRIALCESGVSCRLKLMEQLSGEKAPAVPSNDPAVMSLFHSTDALGISPDDICGIKYGTIGIPEFSDPIEMEPLNTYTPKTFSDLAKITSARHGTDVWWDNAEILIKNGTCSLSDVICCREDIFLFLLKKGIDRDTAYSIAHNVRLGRPRRNRSEYWSKRKEEMLSHDVPEWFIKSCEKIRYLFPKAHMIGYLQNELKFAWYKVHHPQAFYSAIYESLKDTQCSKLSYFSEDPAKLKEQFMKLPTITHDMLYDESYRLCDEFYFLSLAIEMKARGFTVV